MHKIQRVLTCTDFSPRADHAVQRGLLLAVEHAAELDLLHVLPVFPFEAFKRIMVDTPLETEQRLYNEAKRSLQKLADKLSGNGKGIRVGHHVAIGRAHMEINNYAEKHHADLIVIGDQGETLVQEFFLGTTASKTLQTGRLPLLVTKQEPKSRYKHVLVPVDFSQPSLEALKLALKVVTQASVRVLHAVEMPYEKKMNQTGFKSDWVDLYRNRVLGDVRQEMENMVRSCAFGDARVSSIIEHGHPPEVIRDKAQSLGIDLIVIGKRGDTELDEALFGSVTKHVLYETSCDVLLVDPESRREK